MTKLGTLLIGLLLGAGAAWLVADRLAADAPTAETVASASLDAVRAQNCLTVFAGRFTVAVTTRAQKLGLTAQKTMIVPATVRYDVDYSKLRRDDLAWDAEARVLTVRLPAIEIAEPQIDMANIREYEGGTILLAISDAEDIIDKANRGKISAAVRKEANTTLLIDLAKAAARNSVERGFSLPLEAAGIGARVIVRFPEELGYGM